MHDLIFETNIWSLAGSTRLMELHTNRAAKHRQGKKRCKASDIRHFQMKTWTHKSEACLMPNQRPPNSTSARKLIASRKRSSSMEHTICEPNTMEAHGTRDTNAQHTSPLKKNCPARKRRQFNRARRDAKTPKSARQTKKTALVTHTLTKQTTLQRSSISRVHGQRPPAQRRPVNWALYPQTTMYRRSPTDPRVRCDHTEIPHTSTDLAWQPAPNVANQTHGFARKWTTYLQVNNVSLVGREQEEKRRPRPRECKNDKTLDKGNRDKGKTKGQTWENGVKVKTWEKGKRTGEKEKKRPTGQQANGPTVQRANGPTANNGQCSPEYKEKKQYQEHFKKKTIHIIQILQIIWAISIIKNNVNCKNNIHGIKTICNIRIEKNTQCLQWNRIFFFKKKETEMLENPHKVFLIKVVI